MKKVYLDNAASTAVDKRVLDAMHPYWREQYANAGALHHGGEAAKSAVDNARASVASTIHARPDNIVFTSGGTESNNLAIHGTVRACLKKGKKPEELHVVTSAVEHSSVLGCFHALEEEGVRVTYVPVNSDGLIDPQEVKKALTKDTVLVSLIFVHNELGAINDIQKIARNIRTARTNAPYPLFHVDASQAPTWLSINLEKLGVDLMTLDGHKFYGPKGIGCLYVRDKATVVSITHGGGQEGSLRAGTEPVPLVVGFAKALELVEEERLSYVNSIRDMRDRCIQQVERAVSTVRINGPIGEQRVAGNISFSFPDIDGEQLVIELDSHGIAASTASACHSRSDEGSHVMKALGGEEQYTKGTLRLSLSRYTTEKEMRYATEILIEIAVRLMAQEH